MQNLPNESDQQLVVVAAVVIYGAVYTAPAIYESSLWVIWTKVGHRQVAANS